MECADDGFECFVKVPLAAMKDNDPDERKVRRSLMSSSAKLPY